MKEEGKFLRVLSKESVSPPPVWMMRQAGRYLPEYRELRAKAGSFWTMAMTPKFACEITLQPTRRFELDAAVLFSDILVVPLALGLPVEFEAGEGPRLPAIDTAVNLERDPAKWAQVLRPFYDGLTLTRATLDKNTPLIGFAGAPWTLATYMAAGRGKDEQKAAKLWGYRDPQGFDALLDILVDCVAFHLIQQLENGADVVQIFDSWASGLPETAFDRWIVQPTRRVVEKVRAAHPHAKIIGFPRASTLAGYEAYALATNVDAISLDTATPMGWAAKTLGGKFALQGNLDPIALVAGGDALARAVDEILEATRGVPLIFNLGHGIVQETPIAHVEQMLARVRGGR